jgi:3-oxoadipate enol-lactonase
MARCRSNGIELWYELGGAGEPVLFISGTGGDLRVRPNVFDGPLAAVRRILAYDQRGLGRSAKPPGPYTMADYADDAAGLLDALDWPSVQVIGVSFGGMVAQEFALRHPERVTALVRACTSSGGAGGSSYPLHELAGLGDEERLTRQLELADVRRDAAWRNAEPARWQGLLELARAGAQSDRDEAGAKRQLEARARHDTHARLRSLTMPVLIAGGRHDGIAPPANQAALRAAIPGSELAMFEGGHLFFIQDKQAWPAIIDWLAARTG